jgi:murein DD-endopeptidase MepM/ murein hydrolase activator NlpD
MFRWFAKWKQQRHWDSYYSRDYGYADEYQQAWWRRAFLKKVVVAMALFGVFYTFHDGEHWVSQAADNGVRYILNKQIEPADIIERLNLSKYYPGNIDLSVFKNLPLHTGKSQEMLTVPVEGKLAGNFGWRSMGATKEQKYFEGIEIEALPGTGIKAAASGQVKAVTDSAQFGKTVILQHSGDMETIYGYCTDIQVKNGDAVTQGQIIAKVGKPPITADVNKVYFELRVQGQAVDPKTKLNNVGP